MLEEIDTLPRAQREVPVIDRDREAGIRQHGSNVRGGIILPLQIMRVPIVTFGDEPLHECLQIGAGGWVPVLAHHQRGAGMLHEQKAHPFVYTPVTQLGAHHFRNIMQSFIVRGDF